MEDHKHKYTKHIPYYKDIKVLELSISDLAVSKLYATKLYIEVIEMLSAKDRYDLFIKCADIASIIANQAIDKIISNNKGI